MSTCSGCGATNAPDAGHCQKCGQPLETATIPAMAPPVATPAARTSQLAVVSLVLGFFSFFPLFAIPAVIFSHMARSQIRKSAGQLKGAGMALAGGILGYAGLGFFLFLLLGGWGPSLMQYRTAANASSAVGSLRTINTAEISYSFTYPTRGYSATLAQLGPPAQGTGPSHDHSDLIDAALASGEKANYRFTYVAGPMNELLLRTTYTVRADPLKLGERSFFTDETGVIRGEKGKPAGPDSPVLK